MMRNKRIPASLAAVCLLLITALTLCGCASDGTVDPSEDGVLRVVCTVFPGYDFCRELTRGAPEGQVEIILLGKNGQDMHSFEPAAADILTIARADVLVHVGGDSEQWIEAALLAAGNSALRTVSMVDVCRSSRDAVEACTLPDEAHGSDGEHEHDHDADHTHGSDAVDEHVWVSLRNAKLIVSEMTGALMAATSDSALSPLIEANAESYQKALSDMDKQYADMVAAAARSTVVIADRNPFAYLMADYGLTCVAAFPGCSSETQASFATQTHLIEQVRALALPYIFIIDGSDGSVAQTVSEQTGAGVLRLLSGQVVPDADPAAGASYLSIAQANLQSLTMALCDE